MVFRTENRCFVFSDKKMVESVGEYTWKDQELNIYQNAIYSINICSQEISWPLVHFCFLADCVKICKLQLFQIFREDTFSMHSQIKHSVSSKFCCFVVTASFLLPLNGVLPVQYTSVNVTGQIGLKIKFRYQSMESGDPCKVCHRVCFRNTTQDGKHARYN